MRCLSVQRIRDRGRHSARVEASPDRRSLLHSEVAYLRAVETLEKVFFRLVPRPWTTAMIAIEMPAAMRPYSMAVAAVSSLKKASVRFFMSNSWWSRTGTATLYIVIDWSITSARLNKTTIILYDIVITSCYKYYINNIRNPQR